MTTAETRTGRVNQKARTRAAIIEAARALIRADAEVTMPAVAQGALVSEATAYRYFPDLASLLRNAMVDVWASPAEAMAAASNSTRVRRASPRGAAPSRRSHEPSVSPTTW